jgi:uncharacterized membrane protein YkoI
MADDPCQGNVSSATISPGVMKTVLSRRGLLLTLALLVAGGAVVHADEQGDRESEDHDEARRALEKGQVRPLADILADVSDQIDGEVVGVEFERRNGRYFYEFKVITASGSLREVLVDASSAEILSSEDD